MGYVMLLENNLDNPWSVGTVYIGTAHDKEYVTGLHAPKTKIWKSAYLAKLRVKYQNCQWVK